MTNIKEQIDILDSKYKHCWNCKYKCSQDYDDNICKSPDLVKIQKDYTGSLCKEYPYCSDIVTYIGDKKSGYYLPCSHFKRGFWFIIRQKFNEIKEFYYKKRHQSGSYD